MADSNINIYFFKSYVQYNFLYNGLVKDFSNNNIILPQEGQYKRKRKRLIKKIVVVIGFIIKIILFQLFLLKLWRSKETSFKQSNFLLEIA